MLNNPTITKILNKNSNNKWRKGWR